jgi:hypothetical protein
MAYWKPRRVFLGAVFGRFRFDVVCSRFFEF